MANRTFSPTTAPNSTPSPVTQDTQPQGQLQQILLYGVPVYIVILIIAIVILCSCICCVMYHRHIQSKFNKTKTPNSSSSDNDEEESESSIKDYLPEIQKTISPREYRSPHESHRSDFDVFKPTKGAFETSHKRFNFNNTNDIDPILNKQTSDTTVTSTLTSPSKSKASPSTVFIQHHHQQDKDRSRRRGSSKRLEVNRNRSVFDSPVVLSTVPSKNSIQDGLLGHKSTFTRFDSDESLIALDGSVYGAKTYASEGQTNPLRSCRTNTDMTDITAIDDVKMSLPMEDAFLQMPKNPKLDFLDSDEFIVSGSLSVEPGVTTKM